VRFIALIFIAAAQAALAHPGHGPEAGWLHFLSEPDHLALMLAPVIGLLAWRWLRRRRGGG